MTIRTVTFDDKTHRIVPVEPTDKMVNTAWCHGHNNSVDTYHLMLSAAPEFEEVKSEPVAWIYQNANTDNQYLVWERSPGGRNWQPLYTRPVSADQRPVAAAYTAGWKDAMDGMRTQKPVAWISEGGDVSRSKKWMDEMGFQCRPLYTHLAPQQPDLEALAIAQEIGYQAGLMIGRKKVSEEPVETLDCGNAVGSNGLNPCSTHPDAPHGFDKNSSHSEDRYVCECEFWEEPKRAK